VFRLDLGGVYLAIISSGRPERVYATESITGAATWYVGYGQGDAYRARAGEQRVKESGGLCASRNAALDDAWNVWNVPCLQISDDLLSLSALFLQQTPQSQGHTNTRSPYSIAHPRSDYLHRPATLTQATQAMLRAMADTRTLLAGSAPDPDPRHFRSGAPIDTREYIKGDFMVIAPCDLYFDEHLSRYEDYDYTLVHLTQHGAVLRLNHILPAFLQASPRIERASLDYLKRKWGSAIDVKRGREIRIRFHPVPTLDGKEKGDGSRSGTQRALARKS
jgi:hypothetical protein